MVDTIYMIVEGDGEREAAPLLVRRFLQEHFERYEFSIKAMNAGGNSNITKEAGLEKFLEVARRRPDCKGVIVLLDAEKAHRTCPPELAIQLARRTDKLGLPFPVVIVCAVCEYESWFLFNLGTRIRDRIRPESTYIGNPEEECSAKAWLSDNMPSGDPYKETSDQVSMSSYMNIPHTIEHSRSFRRMAHAVEELLAAIDSGTAHVTPLPKSDEET